MVATSSQSGVFYHHHPGGEHEHIHPEDGLVGRGDNDHAHDHHHRHDIAPLGADPDVAELETADPADTGHLHWKSPFHHAARHSLPTLLAAPTIVLLGSPSEPRCPASAAFVGRARSPPLPA